MPVALGVNLGPSLAITGAAAIHQLLIGRVLLSGQRFGDLDGLSIRDDHRFPDCHRTTAPIPVVVPIPVAVPIPVTLAAAIPISVSMAMPIAIPNAIAIAIAIKLAVRLFGRYSREYVSALHYRLPICIKSSNGVESSNGIQSRNGVESSNDIKSSNDIERSSETSGNTAELESFAGLGRQSHPPAA